MTPVALHHADPHLSAERTSHQLSLSPTSMSAGGHISSPSLSPLAESGRLSAELRLECPAFWPAFRACLCLSTRVGRARRSPGRGWQRGHRARPETAPARRVRNSRRAPHQVAITAATLGAARRLSWPAPNAQETLNGGQSRGGRTLRSGRQVKRVALNPRLTADAGQLHRQHAPGQCALGQRCSTPDGTIHG